VFAGLIIAVVLQLLFTLLGVGIGAATVDPLQQSQPGKGLGIGAAIWLFVSSLIATYIGARVAGNLSGSTLKTDRMLHGILTWGTSAILGMVFLTTTVGSLLGGAGSFLGGATAMASRNEAYGANWQQDQTDNRQYAQTGLSPTGRETQDQQTYQTDQRTSDEQRARQTGDVAARRLSQAALWSFFVLLLTGIVAALAGRASTPAAWRRLAGAYSGAYAEPGRA